MSLKDKAKLEFVKYGANSCNFVFERKDVQESISNDNRNLRLLNHKFLTYMQNPEKYNIKDLYEEFLGYMESRKELFGEWEEKEE